MFPGPSGSESASGVRGRGVTHLYAVEGAAAVKAQLPDSEPELPLEGARVHHSPAERLAEEIDAAAHHPMHEAFEHGGLKRHIEETDEVEPRSGERVDQRLAVGAGEGAQRRRADRPVVLHADQALHELDRGVRAGVDAEVEHHQVDARRHVTAARRKPIVGAIDLHRLVTAHGADILGGHRRAARLLQRREGDPEIGRPTGVVWRVTEPAFLRQGHADATVELVSRRGRGRWAGSGSAGRDLLHRQQRAGGVIEVGLLRGLQRL